MPRLGGTMKLDAWFCMDCMAVRDLDIHARCDCCGSDSVTPANREAHCAWMAPASGAGAGFARTAAPDQPLPLIFRVAAGLGGRRAILHQTLHLVSRVRCRSGHTKPMPGREIDLEELRSSAGTAVIGS
jgi:hypothetical protein